MGVRRQAREAALQALFMCDFLGQWEKSSIDFCFDHFDIQKQVRFYAEKLCYGVLDNLTKVDSQITCASENWSIGRMGRVDRSIIRIAVFELVFLPEVPKNVAINEAIEVAKRFGAPDSPMFVNGVLDRVGSMVKPRVEFEVVKAAEEEAEVSTVLPASGDVPAAAE